MERGCRADASQYTKQKHRVLQTVHEPRRDRTSRRANCCFSGMMAHCSQIERWHVELEMDLRWLMIRLLCLLRVLRI